MDYNSTSHTLRNSFLCITMSCYYRNIITIHSKYYQDLLLLPNSSITVEKTEGFGFYLEFSSADTFTPPALFPLNINWSECLLCENKLHIDLVLQFRRGLCEKVCSVSVTAECRVQISNSFRSHSSSLQSHNSTSCSAHRTSELKLQTLAASSAGRSPIHLVMM